MKKAVFVDLLNLFWDQHAIYSLAGVMKQNNIDAVNLGRQHLVFRLGANRMEAAVGEADDQVHLLLLSE